MGQGVKIICWIIYVYKSINYINQVNILPDDATLHQAIGVDIDLIRQGGSGLHWRW